MLLFREESLGIFLGLQCVLSGFSVSHLSYTDDTIIFAEANLNNLWYIKVILRDFEFASGH